jgi:hypothetical protein
MARLFGIQPLIRKGRACFSVRERLVEPRLVIDGRAAKLSPGMSVQAEAVTGEQRVIYYLWSSAAEAGRKR